jgi:hypothetical protein
MIYICILAGGKGTITQSTYWLRWWDQDPNFTFLVYPPEKVPSLTDFRSAISGGTEAVFRAHWKGLPAHRQPNWGTYELGLMTFHLLKAAFDLSQGSTLEDMFYYVSADSIPIARREDLLAAPPATLLGDQMGPTLSYDAVRKECEALKAGTASNKDVVKLMGLAKNEQWICTCKTDLAKIFDERNDVFLARLTSSWIILKAHMDGRTHVKYPDEFFPQVVFACAGVQWSNGSIMAQYRPEACAYSPVAFGEDEPQPADSTQAVQKLKPVFWFHGDYYRATLNGAIWLSCALRYAHPGDYSHTFFFRKVAAAADPSDWLLDEGRMYEGVREAWTLLEEGGFPHRRRLGPYTTFMSWVTSATKLLAPFQKTLFLEEVGSADAAALAANARRGSENDCASKAELQSFHDIRRHTESLQRTRVRQDQDTPEWKAAFSEARALLKAQWRIHVDHASTADKAEVRAAGWRHRRSLPNMDTQTLRQTITALTHLRLGPSSGPDSEGEESASDGTSDSLASDREDHALEILGSVQELLARNDAIRREFSVHSKAAPSVTRVLREPRDGKYGSWTNPEEGPTEFRHRRNAMPSKKSRRRFLTLLDEAKRSPVPERARRHQAALDALAAENERVFGEDSS